MGWRACGVKEAQQAADNGTAAMGISEDRIVVLTAADEEDTVDETAAVMSCPKPPLPTPLLISGFIRMEL